MNKLIFSPIYRASLLATSISLLAACGSGGGGSPAAYTAQPGIYSGTFSPTGGITDVFSVIVTSNNKWAGADPDEAATGTVSGGTLSNAYGFTATLTGTMSGSYDNGTESGTFSLVDAGIYNRTSSLAKLNGTWVDNVYTASTGVTTWVINNGAYSMTSVSGCASTGTITTIDTSKNEYAVTGTVTNCGGFNGSYSGYGFTDDDTFTDDQFSIVIDNATSYAVFSPIKQ